MLSVLARAERAQANCASMLSGRRQAEVGESRGTSGLRQRLLPKLQQVARVLLCLLTGTREHRHIGAVMKNPTCVAAGSTCAPVLPLRPSPFAPVAAAPSTLTPSKKEYMFSSRPSK
eukprot:1091137-Pelagomonas_calceolata.AAC.5